MNRTHLRQRYGLSRPRSEGSRRPQPRDDLSATALKSLVSRSPSLQSVGRAKRYLARIQPDPENALEQLAVGRGRLEVCMALSEAGEHTQALECCEFALVTLDPVLRHAVAGTAPIPPDVASALVETACLCYCNAGLELHALEGEAASIRVLRQLGKGVALARGYFGSDGPLVPYLEDVQERLRECSIRSLDRPTLKRQSTPTWLKNQEVNDGMPLTMTFRQLNQVTDNCERVVGSSNQDGVKPLLETTKERADRDNGSRKKVASKLLPGAEKTRRPSPFVSYEDKARIKADRRKYLYFNEHYVKGRSAEFQLEAVLLKQLKDIMPDDELYDNNVFYNSFALKLRKKIEKKKATEAWEDNARENVHDVMDLLKNKNNKDSQKKVFSLLQGKSSSTNVLVDMTQRSGALGKAFGKMKAKASVAKANIELFGADKKGKKGAKKDTSRSVQTAGKLVKRMQQEAGE